MAFFGGLGKADRLGSPFGKVGRSRTASGETQEKAPLIHHETDLNLSDKGEQPAPASPHTPKKKPKTPEKPAKKAVIKLQDRSSHAQVVEEKESATAPSSDQAVDSSVVSSAKMILPPFNIARFMQESTEGISDFYLTYLSKKSCGGLRNKLFLETEVIKTPFLKEISSIFQTFGWRLAKDASGRMVLSLSESNVINVDEKKYPGFNSQWKSIMATMDVSCRDMIERFLQTQGITFENHNIRSFILPSISDIVNGMLSRLEVATDLGIIELEIIELRKFLKEAFVATGIFDLTLLDINKLLKKLSEPEGRENVRFEVSQLCKNIATIISPSISNTIKGMLSILQNSTDLEVIKRQIEELRLFLVGVSATASIFNPVLLDTNELLNQWSELEDIKKLTLEVSRLCKTLTTIVVEVPSISESIDRVFSALLSTKDPITTKIEIKELHKIMQESATLFFKQYNFINFLILQKFNFETLGPEKQDSFRKLLDLLGRLVLDITNQIDSVMVDVKFNKGQVYEALERGLKNEMSEQLDVLKLVLPSATAELPHDPSCKYTSIQDHMELLKQYKPQLYDKWVITIHQELLPGMFTQRFIERFMATLAKDLGFTFTEISSNTPKSLVELSFFAAANHVNADGNSALQLNRIENLIRKMHDLSGNVGVFEQMEFRSSYHP